MLQRLDDSSPLVLGSGSPRRREILTSLLIPHVVRPAAADETVREGEAPDAYLARVVLAKLDAVRALARALSPEQRAEGRVVLVADTAVIDDGAILGKPGSREEAEAMITRLAGKTHEVHTRFALAALAAAAGDAPAHAETVVTRVTFRRISPDEARAYAVYGEGTDKAGGYAVQGFGAGFVSRIEGSYANVVGLPACELVVALARLGLR